MPLANLLAPQLLRKAQQIQADLGRGPQPTGYLDATAKPQPLTYEAVGGHAPGTAPRYNPDDPRNKFTRMLGSLQHSPNPVNKQLGLSIPGAQARAALREKARLPDVAAGNPDTIRQMPIPLAAGSAPQGTAIALTERGEPIYAPASALPTRKGPIMIKLPGKGVPIGLNEKGRAIDVRGKQLGYLNQGLPEPDPNLRNPMRRSPIDKEGNVVPGAEAVLRTNPAGISDFDAKWLQKLYGDDLKAMQYDRAAGDMRFPDGYFDGMSEGKRNSIIRGVEALRQLQQGVRT